MSDGETIRVCPGHREEYVVPVIFTVFAGAEKWCPYCGWVTGSFFSDHSVEVEATEELALRHRIYYEATLEYLRSVRSVDPTLPWRYRQKAEDLGIELDATLHEVKCDGCGKVARVPEGYDKPAHWYARKDEETGVQRACSRECIDKIAKATGVTGMVLPW